MTLKFLYTVCFATAIFCFGCQEQKTSVNSGETLNRQTAGQADKTIVIAYYFHRTIRCPACLATEANTARTIKDNFSEQTASGRLLWMPVNLDEPESEEFEKEFGNILNTLVVVKTKNGNTIEYKKLEKVWELLNDYNAFSEYVMAEVKQYLTN